MEPNSPNSPTHQLQTRQLTSFKLANSPPPPLPSQYSIVLDEEISDTEDYYVRVAAFNTHGCGDAKKAWPEYIRPALTAPTRPLDVTVDVDSETSLEVSWDAPTSNGGDDVAHYYIEWDTMDTFKSQCAEFTNCDAEYLEPLGGYTITESDADVTLGSVNSTYPNSDDAAERKLVDVYSTTDMDVGDKISIDGSTYTITKISSLTLTLDKEYTGTRVLHGTVIGSSKTVIKVFAGAQSLTYSYTIPDLAPGIPYFIRVTAINTPTGGTSAGELLYSPSTYAGYPGVPTSAVPMAVPDTVSYIQQHVSSDARYHPASTAFTQDTTGSLRVDYVAPYEYKAEGANGAPVSSYEVQLATAVNEVQTIDVAVYDETVSGSYKLELKSDKNGTTTCIPLDASAHDLKLRLEEMNYVDGVDVTKVSTSTGYSYSVTFTGPWYSNGNQEEMVVTPGGQAGCAGFGGADKAVVSVSTVTQGSAAAVPEVVEIKTTALTALSGSFDLAFDYSGDFSMLIADTAYELPERVSVSAGWTTVTTTSDLRTVLERGDFVKIGGEIHTISSDATWTATSMPLTTYVEGATDH